MGEIEEFWNKAHKESNVRYLAGCQGQGIWDELQINHLIQPNNRVLNIGVGMGHCTRALHDARMVICVLDISFDALLRVEDIVDGGFLAKDIKHLPVEFFDLVISHLVAQHMSDNDLEEQIKYVIRSLNSDGVFAMQFLSQITYIGGNKCQQGLNARSLEVINDMVSRNSGEISLVLHKQEFKSISVDDQVVDAEWQFVHIKRRSG